MKIYLKKFVSGQVTLISALACFAFSPTAQAVDPPVITVQPIDKTETEGETAKFIVTASGTEPLSYQWRKNGLDIAGAISSSYTTRRVTRADDGSAFSVVVSNRAGSVTSVDATLTVPPNEIYGYAPDGTPLHWDVYNQAAPVRGRWSCSFMAAAIPADRPRAISNRSAAHVT